MPRKRKSKQEFPATEPVAVAVEEPVIEEAQAEEAPPEHEFLRQPTGPSLRYTEGWTKMVNLGPGKIRFRVSTPFNQFQIAFDDACKPDAETKDILTEEGWRYMAAEKLWFAQRDRTDKYTSTIRAEQFFKHLADELRQQNGLEPSQAI